MDLLLKTQVEYLLQEKLGYKTSIADSSLIGGGCISKTSLIRTKKGHCFFLKQNSSNLLKMFRAEATGLLELSKNTNLSIPTVIGYGSTQSNISFLLLEYLQPGKKINDFFGLFGQQFAQMHKIKKSRYGFSENNFIGSNPQINDWSDSWVTFFREQRLGYQITISKTLNLWDSKLNKMWEKLSNRLDQLIGEPYESPSLLHGDLWAGNFLIGPAGKPCLIDPAVYYGSREADLAMTKIFGGFTNRFYEAYHEAYPLEPGYDERMEIYKLYHLLNHLNLFGQSYLDSVRSILLKFY